MTKVKVVIVILAILNAISLNAQTLAKQLDDCLVVKPISADRLPSNMRIIVDNLDKQELVLLNPNDNSSSAIPNTSYISSFSGLQRSGIPILFDNGTRMLLFKEQNVQTIDIDGTNIIDMPDRLPQALGIHTFNDRGQVLFVKIRSDDTPWLEAQYRILDATTGNIIDFNFPELVNFTQIPSRSDPIPIEWKVNPSFDYQAYEARREPIVDPYGINDLVRVQNILSGESYDITLTNSFVLSWKSDYLLGILDFIEGIEYIIDVRNNELFAQIKFPPRDGLEFTPPSILSPDENMFVYQSVDENNNKVLALVDKADQHVNCLLVGNYPSQMLITYQELQWSANSRLLWWLECSIELDNFNQCDEERYNLMIFDRETNQYGVLIADVGINTRIGFIDS